MIKITIERYEVRETKETKNFIIKKTATDKKKESDYGNKSEPLFDEEYQPQEITNREMVKTTLLQQEIQIDAAFNLKRVIAAINDMNLGDSA